MYRNIVKRKIDKYCEENSIDNCDLGFLKFVNEVFYNGGITEMNESIIESSIVDGQSDKQIDLIQIENGETITIRIFQVKNKNGFESNVVILLKNGLDWIFSRDEEEVFKLPNSSFRDRIIEVRDILATESLKNIYIDVCYVTIGNTDDIRENDEIVGEIKELKKKYISLFENFRFELYGAKELIEYVDLLNDKSVNTDIELIYDTNIPSLIENRYDGIKSLVCNVKASELLKIFSVEKSEYLFEQNVRKYLEDRSKVNKNIIETAGNGDSQYFWALNNGVTIICDEYDLHRVGGKAILKMKNLQVINGCQTTMSLYQASSNNSLNDNTSLLLRIHETQDEKVIEKIILATNNQNPINPKDLISNSISQVDLQRYFFEIYGVFYQRKRNDFRDINGKLVNKKEIISNDKVGQAALACIKCMPNVALASKGRVYSTDMDVFDKNKEHIALSYFIHEKVLEYSKSADIKNNSELVSVIKFGRFHLTYQLFKQYLGKISVDLNKKIKHGDIDLSNDIFLATFILNESLPGDKKANLLAYFKSKDSLKKINEVILIVNNIKNIINTIISVYSGNEDFDINKFCEDGMTFEIDMTEIKINNNGRISIYRRLIYDDYEEQNEDFNKEEENFTKTLENNFNMVPENEDDSCIGCPATDVIVGYFNIEFDKDMVEKFINISIA